MEAANDPKPGTTGQSNHKSSLQEHAQRSAILLPMYQTVNEGPPHAPQFRSTVIVDGGTFVSSSTFARRKDAEQDVAKVALEGISWKIKHEGIPLIHNDTIFCKSILNEYAIKMNIEKPTFTTAESKGLFPLFISSVVFNGSTYKGVEGKNKKEAEQIAARAVIESILGSSNTATVMSQIIKSKGRLYAAMHKGSSSCVVQDINVSLGEHIQNIPTNSTGKGKEIQGALTNDKLPPIVSGEAFSSGQPSNAATINSASTIFKDPKEEHICELSGSIGNGKSLSAIAEGDQPSGSTGRVIVSVPDESCFEKSIHVKEEAPLDGLPVVSNGSQSLTHNTGQKRKNKKRGNRSKRTRTDEQPSV